MSVPPRTESELELGADARLEELLASMRSPGAGGALGRSANPLGYVGLLILSCVFAVALAWPVAFSAALAWHLAQSGWGVFS